MGGKDSQNIQGPQPYGKTQAQRARLFQVFIRARQLSDRKATVKQLSLEIRLVTLQFSRLLAGLSPRLNLDDKGPQRQHVSEQGRHAKLEHGHLRPPAK